MGSKRGGNGLGSNSVDAFEPQMHDARRTPIPNRGPPCVSVDSP